MNFPWIPNHAYWAHKSLRLRTHLRLHANGRKRQQSMGFSLLKPKPWIHIPDICPAHSWKYSNAWEFYLSQTKVQLKLPIFAWMHIPFLSFLEAESFETFLSWITTDWIRCFRYGRVFLWCVDSLYFDLRFKLRIVNFTERLLSWETTSIVSVLYSVVPRNPFSWKIHRKN